MTYFSFSAVNAFVAVDSSKFELKTPFDAKSRSNRCEFKSVVVSLPDLSDGAAGDVTATASSIDNRQLMSGLAVGPWSFTVEQSLTYQRWKRYEDRPWTRVKFASDSLVLNVNPSYLERAIDVVANYASAADALRIENEQTQERTARDDDDDGKEMLDYCSRR